MYRFFFFNDTATTEIYTLSLHDALPILIDAVAEGDLSQKMALKIDGQPVKGEFLRIGTTVNGMVDQLSSFADEVTRVARRSEEHTSELQSRQYLVCRLLLEKKKKRYQRF